MSSMSCLVWNAYFRARALSKLTSISVNRLLCPPSSAERRRQFDLTMTWLWSRLLACATRRRQRSIFSAGNASSFVHSLNSSVVRTENFHSRGKSVLVGIQHYFARGKRHGLENALTARGRCGRPEQKDRASGGRKSSGKMWEQTGYQ